MRALLIPFAALAIAAPAVAQSPSELIGTYRMTVEPEPGSLCPAGQADFEVIAINGDQIEVALDHTRVTAEYHPEMQTFVGMIPFPDAEHQIRMDGGFSRGAGLMNLIVTVEFPPERPCKALLSGSIPAAAAEPVAPSAPAAPALGSAPAAPVSSGPPIFGVAPNNDPVAYPSSRPPLLRDGKLLSWTGVLSFIAGIVIRLALRRRKDAAPAPATPAAAAPPTPAPPPPPASELAAAPAPPPVKKPSRRKKPTPQEELNEGSDELGEG